MQSVQEKGCSLAWNTVNQERTAAPGDADGALIARVLAGDRSAFDTLFLKYQDYVYNIVFGIVGRAEEAHDVAQDVFVQVFRSLGSFRRGSRFATWLYRIAVNRAVDAARSARTRRWLPFDETLSSAPDPTQDPAGAAQQSAERDMVQRVLMEVAVNHRDVLVLRYYQDLSIEEIAEVLACSSAAAKVRLHRARHHFKEKFSAIYGPEHGQVESVS
jgi:RNA polymerase sigma-70 factor (ECF subfamily)